MAAAPMVGSMAFCPSPAGPPKIWPKRWAVGVVVVLRLTFSGKFILYDFPGSPDLFPIV